MSVFVNNFGCKIFKLYFLIFDKSYQVKGTNGVLFAKLAIFRKHFVYILRVPEVVPTNGSYRTG